MKEVTPILIASLIFIKIILGSIFLYRAEFDPLFIEKNAIASEIDSDSNRPSKPVRHVPISLISSKSENILKIGKDDFDLFLEKRAELEKKEKELAKKKEELLSIQKDITHKIKTLTQLRNEIRSERAKKRAVEDQKLKHLMKVFSTMKPQNAARLIEKLDIGFAVKILSRMKGEVVGRILSFVSTGKAARISEALLKRNN